MKIKFKKGDIVRVVKYSDGYFGRPMSLAINSVSKIKDVNCKFDQDDYVAFLLSDNWWYLAEELILDSNVFQTIIERFNI